MTALSVMYPQRIISYLIFESLQKVGQETAMSEHTQVFVDGGGGGDLESFASFRREYKRQL